MAMSSMRIRDGMEYGVAGAAGKYHDCRETKIRGY